jgi:hypothetical protein
MQCSELTSWAAQPDVLVNEAREMLNSVQKRLSRILCQLASSNAGLMEAAELIKRRATAKR